MPIAVRIQKLDSDSNPIGNIDFYRYEQASAQVVSDQESVVQKAQNGAPTLFIQNDEYAVLQFETINYGKSTTDKFTELRNFINAGGIVRVYHKYYYEVYVAAGGGGASSYYDCFIKPETLPIEQLFSGEYKRGDKIKLLFYETDQDSQYVVSEEIVIES